MNAVHRTLNAVEYAIVKNYRVNVFCSSLRWDDDKVIIEVKTTKSSSNIDKMYRAIVKKLEEECKNDY